MSIVDVFVGRAQDGEVRAVHTEGWTDVSHLWEVVEVNWGMVDREGANCHIHPTAHVADDAVLGEDARVGQRHCPVRNRARGQSRRGCRYRRR